MAYTNHIISAPVSISDVQAAVGHTSGDLATLILEGIINKWAKYKPGRLCISIKQQRRKGKRCQHIIH